MQYIPYSEEYLRDFYRYVDENGRRYRLDNLRNPGVRPNLMYEYKGYKPHPNGWAMTREKMEQLDAERRLYFPKSPDGRIQLKRYLDEMPGNPVGSVWTDIKPIGAQAQERLGYPTQKPEALLERIIQASSNEEDVVLDPFCGCGTAVAAAHRLKRRWIGIDVTQIAITLIKNRLLDAFGQDVVKSYTVVGEPTTLPEAHKLAEDDKHQFQVWALGLVGARPQEMKKGADQGIDGRLLFHYGEDDETKQVILSVKGGHNIGVGDVRDLGHVVTREKAVMGVLISLYPPTGPMLNEAREAGEFVSPWGKHPRLQILTVAELLGGKRIDMPPILQVNRTFKRAPKAKSIPVAAQLALEDAAEG